MDSVGKVEEGCTKDGLSGESGGGVYEGWTQWGKWRRGGRRMDSVGKAEEGCTKDGLSGESGGRVDEGKGK